jgi:hypothetical protein
MKFKIYPDFEVFADQKTLDETEVLNDDIYGMIAPFATANFWVSTQPRRHKRILSIDSGGLIRRNSTGVTTMLF